MRQILKDEILNNQLETHGFIVVPFLEQPEKDSLISVFNSIPQNEVIDFYASSHQNDTEFRKSMNSVITQNLQKAVDSAFINMDLLGGSFIAKQANYNELLYPHQDWNIVDENQYRSYNIWIPLIDTTKNNGAIMVMPKSHKWIQNYRHSSIPCAFQPIQNLLLENMLTLEIKAGQALIYDHALIHASHPNLSNEARVAIASGVKPNEAELLIYWKNGLNIEEYSSSVDYFMSENIFSKPEKLVKTKTFEYSTISVDETKFYQLTGIQPPIKNDPIPKVKKSFFQTYTPSNILKELIYRIRK